jgi:hypothetical protein
MDTVWQLIATHKATSFMSRDKSEARKLKLLRAFCD